MDKKQLSKLLEEYLRETIIQVREIASKEEGRKILATVINRPEDVEIEIDHVGEEILKDLLEKDGLSATIFSEPENGEIITGENPDFYGAIDPFDNSAFYMRGLEHNWYTVLSFFDKENNPLCCGIGDILNEKMWIFDGDKNFVINIKSGKKTEITRSLKKTLTEPLVLASYMMSSQYSVKFFDVYGDMIKKMHPRALLYSNGGSYIYSHLAQGLVDAYVMFDEPRSEIDPGFAIAKAAGCLVGEVDKDGNWKDYEFIPGKQHDSVPLLIAACTLELRDELVEYYKSYNK